jgi:prepilin-type N-terminal cleavage/methylation domain-containing protein
MEIQMDSTYRAKKERRKKRTLFSSLGFTLVEILVVIAVIGLLSSIIFAITRGADEQGRIARGLYFSQHLQNSLGSYAAGIWSFDEGSGSTANDISGWNNNGTISGATYSTDTPSGSGYSLSFNGISDNVAALNSPTLNEDRTFEAWIKPTSGTEAMTIIEEGVGSAAQMYYVYTTGANSGKLAVDSWSRGWHYSSALVNIGKWNHVVFVYNSSNMKIKFYINGVYDTETPAYNSPGFYDTNDINIGGDPILSSGTYYNGLIDEVRIYATALTAFQIQSQYHVGLKRLLVRNQIKQREYEQWSSKT